MKYIKSNNNLYFFLILFLVSSLSNMTFGQVGINTTNPQQDLHVAGNNSTIRIDGLNSTNNPNNNGNANLSVNADGDLTVRQTFEVIENSNNIIGTPIAVQTTNTAGLNEQELYVRPFTLNNTTANTAKAYGMSSSIYTNMECDTASGYVFSTKSVMIPLSAGNHSIHMNGAVYGGNLTNDAAFTGVFGAQDSLDITAINL